MKKYFLILCLCLLSVAIHAQAIKVATYNLRYDTPADSLDSWNKVQAAVRMMSCTDRSGK